MFKPLLLFQAIIIIVFCYEFSNAQSGRHCGAIYKRGNKISPAFNFTLGTDGKSYVVTPRNIIGLVGPEPSFDCTVEISSEPPRFDLMSMQTNVLYDLENTVGRNEKYKIKLCCYCRNSQCLATELEDNTCAQLFQLKNCNSCFDPGYKVPKNTKGPNLPHEYKYRVSLKGDPDELTLGSLIVNWGCKLQIFQYPNFQGSSRIFYNGYHDNVYISYGGFLHGAQAGSYTCQCPRNKTMGASVEDEENKAIGEWITVVSNANETNTKSEIENSRNNNSIKVD